MAEDIQFSSDGSTDIATIAVDQHGNVTVVDLTGEIDISNIELVSEAVAALPNTGPGLIFDLTGVTYIDSTAVSLFHNLAARLRQRAARLVVVSPAGSPPHRVLELTALDATATVTDALESAIDIVQTRTGPPPAS